jgi:predicted molibdopterin-dependent oxidoreductase YjgC
MEWKMIINRREAAFEPGRTILEVASANGIRIPTLCHLKDTNPTGLCRICVVEVEGHDRLLPSCATPASDGMVILTDSPRVRTARKAILEMLLASGQHNCFVTDLDPDRWTDYQIEAMGRPWHQVICPAWGHCQLQDLVVEYGVRTEGIEPKSCSDAPLDDQQPLIVRDFARCIQCGRCIAACNEVQINLAIPYPYGRREDRPQPEGWYPLADYNKCTHCGECVQACPVGALFEKRSFGLALEKELDRVKTTCTYCGVGCQIWLHIKKGRITKVTGVEGSIPNLGRLCVKGRFGFEFVHSHERLTHPLIKEEGQFREASWEEALDLVARRFSEIKQAHGGDSLAGLSSARVTNEENYLMQKLIRAGFGTNNVDHCARL